MPNLSILKIIVRETLSRGRIERVPEPSLIMNDEEQVQAYITAGRETGVMALTYLFHGAHISDVIKPGDRVLDLACGPANQLALVARLNPGVSFVGIDLSQSMLAQAKALIEAQGINNVSLQEGDITRLSEFADHSFDAVVSTFSLHHLANIEMLCQTFTQASRVLRPNGGVYIADFSRLKLRSSMECFAYQYADKQPALFTQDYLNSLLAAFTLEELKAAAAPLARRAKLFSTRMVSFMASFKSPIRQPANPKLHVRFKELIAALPACHQADLAGMIRLFRMGGMTSALLT